MKHSKYIVSILSLFLIAGCEGQQSSNNSNQSSIPTAPYRETLDIYEKFGKEDNLSFKLEEYGEKEFKFNPKEASGVAFYFGDKVISNYKPMKLFAADLDRDGYRELYLEYIPGSDSMNHTLCGYDLHRDVELLNKTEKDLHQTLYYYHSLMKNNNGITIGRYISATDEKPFDYADLYYSVIKGEKEEIHFTYSWSKSLLINKLQVRRIIKDDGSNQLAESYKMDNMNNCYYLNAGEKYILEIKADVDNVYTSLPDNVIAPYSVENTEGKKVYLNSFEQIEHDKDQVYYLRFSVAGNDVTSRIRLYLSEKYTEIYVKANSVTGNDFGDTAVECTFADDQVTRRFTLPEFESDAFEIRSVVEENNHYYELYRNNVLVLSHASYYMFASDLNKDGYREIIFLGGRRYNNVVVYDIYNSKELLNFDLFDNKNPDVFKPSMEYWHYSFELELINNRVALLVFNGSKTTRNFDYAYFTYSPENGVKLELQNMYEIESFKFVSLIDANGNAVSKDNDGYYGLKRDIQYKIAVDVKRKDNADLDKVIPAFDSDANNLPTSGIFMSIDGERVHSLDFDFMYYQVNHSTFGTNRWQFTLNEHYADQGIIKMMFVGFNFTLNYKIVA